MKKKYIITIITAVIILSSAVGFYFLKKNLHKDETVTMEMYTIPSTDKIFINGIISPKDTKNIFLDPTKGNVNEVLVKNSQQVKKGDTLFTYKNDQIASQIEQINFQLSNAKDQKKQLESQKNEMKNQVLEANKQGQQDIGSENTGEVGNLNILSKGISTGNIDEQIKVYEKQIGSLKDKEYTKVTAPIDGKVIIHNSEKNPSIPYMTIETIDFYVSGNVNEKDQPKLKSNQVAEVTILSTNENINGKIASIGENPVESSMVMSNLGSQQGGAGGNNMSYYTVDIDLDSQEHLTNGFHVQATVNLDEQPIKIPKKAILNDENGEYVFKNVNKKLVKQVITYTDNNDSDEVVVTTGLNENDEVITNVNKDMKEGMPVE